MVRRLQIACFVALLALLSLPVLATPGEADFQRGAAAFQRGDLAAAAKAFEAAVRKEPRDAVSRLWLGITYARLGQVEPARAALREASRLGGSSEAGAQARRTLAKLETRAPSKASSPGTTQTASSTLGRQAAPGSTATQTPTDWRPVGAIDGLLGDDWYVRDTKTCRAWARKGDLAYLEEVVASLDQAYEINARYMGFRPPIPLSLYFFSLSEPAYLHPKFLAHTRKRRRFMGLAIGADVSLVNLGSRKSGRHYKPWEVTEAACHEMNHMFLFALGLHDRTGDWSWLAEGLAHAVENQVLPASRHLTMDTMKLALHGYEDVDGSWQQLVGARDDESVTLYRTYGTLLASIPYFMQGAYGKDAIPRLMKAARTMPLDEAFQEAFGKDVAGLHKDWKAFYGIR